MSRKLPSPVLIDVKSLVIQLIEHLQDKIQSKEIVIWFLLGFVMASIIAFFLFGLGANSIHHESICFSREVAEPIIRSWYNGS